MPQPSDVDRVLGMVGELLNAFGELLDAVGELLGGTDDKQESSKKLRKE